MEDYESDYCEECRALGDDYFVDTTGELVCACIDCPFNQTQWGD